MTIDMTAQILRATAQEIAAHGPQSVTFASVAKRLDIPLRRVRARFASRSTLLRRTSVTNAALWEMEMMDSLRKVPSDATSRERLATLARSLTHHTAALASVLLTTPSESLRRPWVDVLARWTNASIASRVASLSLPRLRSLVDALQRRTDSTPDART